MEYVYDYLHPELAILIPVLYFIGMGIKRLKPQAKSVIPLILMTIGIILAALWTMGNGGHGMDAVFVSVTQGVICAAVAVHGYELFKRKNKCGCASNDLISTRSNDRVV